MLFLATDFVRCVIGGTEINNIPVVLPNLVSLIVNIIKVVVPIILIIFGMIDLGKAVAAGKEDDIKKGQSTFVKRLIAAVTVFLVVSIVQLVFSVLSANTGDTGITDCVSCFINGSDSASCKK